MFLFVVSRFIGGLSLQAASNTEMVVKKFPQPGSVLCFVKMPVQRCSYVDCWRVNSYSSSEEKPLYITSVNQCLFTFVASSLDMYHTRGTFGGKEVDR